jgi:hypothetical protein
MTPMDEPRQSAEWPVLFARRALKMGMRVPEIEQQLVSQGLSPEEANRLVMGILEGDIQQQKSAWIKAERGKPIRLLLSAVLGGVCLWLAFRWGGGLSVDRALIFLVPALGGIWLPELTDTEDSDWGLLSQGTGWILLFLYLGYRVFLWVMVP